LIKRKIISKINEILKKPNSEIQELLSEKEKFNFSENYIKSFLNYKQDFVDRISTNKNFILPSIEGFAMANWNKFFTGIVHEVGVEIDTPVTIDIHRLIRYPGSLHGKTGFRVQELFPDELDNFNPLDEVNEKLDPIVFKSNKSQEYGTDDRQSGRQAVDSVKKIHGIGDTHQPENG